MTVGAGVVRGHRRGAAVVAVVAAMLAMSAAAVVIDAAESGASPIGVGPYAGYYAADSSWRYGTVTDPDPSHTAYSFSPVLDRFSSLDIRREILNVADPQYADGVSVDRQVSVSGIPGAVASFPVFGGGDIRVLCESPSAGGVTCPVPSRSYVITLGWTDRVRDGDCYRAWFAEGDFTPPLDEVCPRFDVSDTVTRTVVEGAPDGTTTTTSPPQDPTAGFTWAASFDDPFEVGFENRSADVEDDREEMTYRWAFGDGETSTELSPTHRYARAGVFPVTLTVTDSSGRTDEATQEVTIANGLVVNSTGDSSALDPAERGCDTGAVIDDEPECTLRAALETAEELGGGEVSFAIEDVGTPTIVTDAALPAATTDVVIDGTTQAGGWVGVQAVGERGVQATGGTLVVRGLVVSGVPAPIYLSGGTGHVIEGNRVGTDLTGTASTGAGDEGYGIAFDTPATTVRDNVIAAGGGIGTGSRATDAVVEDNHVGVSTSGVTLGQPLVGVVLAGPGATVTGNEVTGSVAGVLVLTAGAAGASVVDNHVGRTAAGADLDMSGEGIRVDGAPGASVSGNVVSTTGPAGIAVSGSNQSTIDDDGFIELEDPSDRPLPSPDTGGTATIVGNTVSDASKGIAVWAGADDVVVDGNTVVEDGGSTVWVRGGSGHRVVGNTLGSAEDPAGTGVSTADVFDSVIGSPDDGNVITSASVGIAVGGTGDGVRVEANTVVGGGAAGGLVGIRVAEGSTGVVVVGNATTGGATGIEARAAAATITGNTVSGATETGLAVFGDRTIVEGNVAVEGGDGVAVGGDEVVVKANRIGVRPGTTTVAGTTGTGLAVLIGDAAVERNIVVGSGADGIHVADGATAELRANRVWATGAEPIAVASGPEAPTIAGVLRSGAGDAMRTTIVIGDVPSDGGGRIELFANDDCTDPEAKYLMEVVRTTKPGRASRIIQVKGATSRDHFTVTYTSPDGATSALSECRSVSTYADGDGDGSVDPIDGAIGVEDDPRNAVVVTDDETLLLVSLAEGDGRLERVALGADPAPDSHPAGWQLAYGALGFRIAGLASGGSAIVTLTTLDGDAPVAGTSYWKYGPPTVGAGPSWYRFDLDEADETGAALVTTEVLGSLRRTWALALRDGARGDSDGGANGSITDPGGPVIGATAPVEPPTAPPDDPPVAVPPITTPAATGGNAPSSPSTGATAPRPLARTGSDLAAATRLGLALLALGAAATALVRRTRHLAR